MTAIIQQEIGKCRGVACKIMINSGRRVVDPANKRNNIILPHKLELRHKSCVLPEIKQEAISSCFGGDVYIVTTWCDASVNKVWAEYEPLLIIEEGNLLYTSNLLNDICVRNRSGYSSLPMELKITDKQSE